MISNSEWAKDVQAKLVDLNGLLMEAPARDVIVGLKATAQRAGEAYHEPITITLSERLY